jgi:hypothetical protein
MSQGICSQCGADIDGTSIRHRRRLFCSDECCETFEEEFLTKGVPGRDELDAEPGVDVDFDEDDLEDGELEEEDDSDLDEDDDD